MGFVQKLKLRDPSGTKNAPTRKAVLYVVDDATGEATPVTAGQLGGGGGGGGTAPTSPVVTTTYPPQNLTVTATEAGLTVPAGATTSFVTVLTGQARIGLDSATAAPIYNAGDTIELSGAELAALRLVRVGATDATVRAEYWSGGSSTSGGSREATQLQVRAALLTLVDTESSALAKLEALRVLLADTNAHAQASNGNTYILANQAQGAGLKTQLPADAATDSKLETLRLLLAGTLGISAASLPLPAGAATDAKLETLRALLAGSLTVNTGLTGLATQATLEAVRVLLTGNLKTTEQVVAPGTLVGDIPAGTSTGGAMNAAGLSGVRLVIGSVWTAADISFETSTDGVTWVPLYDASGSLFVYKAAASRAITVPVGDLLRINRVRVRSGVPGAYVNQVALAGVTLVTAGL